MSMDPSADIHPTAVVEDGATIGPSAKVGPFSLIGRDVTLAAGVEVKSHAVVTGQTSIGEDTVIFPGEGLKLLYGSSALILHSIECKFGV